MSQYHQDANTSHIPDAVDEFVCRRRLFTAAWRSKAFDPAQFLVCLSRIPPKQKRILDKKVAGLSISAAEKVLEGAMVARVVSCAGDVSARGREVIMGMMGGGMAPPQDLRRTLFLALPLLASSTLLISGICSIHVLVCPPISCHTYGHHLRSEPWEAYR